jgi:drug/metabolite transporter (DMT)-like permease
MNTELRDFMGRPKQYDNIDGTGEMSLGLMMLGFALLSYLWGVLPESWSGKHNPVGFLLLFNGGVGAMLGLIYWNAKAIKKHITWPRTGYVAYRRDRKSRWIVIVAAAAFATGCVCLMEFTRRHDWISLQRMCYLALWVPVYALWIYRMERHHPWKWLVLFFMALGLLAIGLIGPGDIVGLGRPVGLFLGLTWLGSGAATLYLYIRHTQPPAPEIE